MRKMRSYQIVDSYCEDWGNGIGVFIPRAINVNEKLVIAIFLTGDQDHNRNNQIMVKAEILNLKGTENPICYADLLNDYTETRLARPPYSFVEYNPDKSTLEQSVKITFYDANGQEFLTNYSVFDREDTRVSLIYESLE